VRPHGRDAADDGRPRRGKTLDSDLGDRNWLVYWID
jgi:hypothetical protein